MRPTEKAHAMGGTPKIIFIVTRMFSRKPVIDIFPPLRITPNYGHTHFSPFFPFFTASPFFFLPSAQYRHSPSHSHALRSSDTTLAVAHEAFNLSFGSYFKAAALITRDIFNFARGFKIREGSVWDFLTVAFSALFSGNPSHALHCKCSWWVHAAQAAKSRAWLWDIVWMMMVMMKTPHQQPKL